MPDAPLHPSTHSSEGPETERPLEIPERRKNPDRRQAERQGKYDRRKT